MRIEVMKSPPEPLFLVFNIYNLFSVLSINPLQKPGFKKASENFGGPSVKKLPGDLTVLESRACSGVHSN
jgi:hypothetical protein